jgi:malyl-CoA/(S)-citramalyl-CoA lyase
MDRTPLPPQRSLLAVPATSPRFLEKGAQSAADAVFIDLEDAVVAGLKVEARARAIEALNTLDWGDRIVSVRVNAFDTPWGVRDIVELAEACPRLDRILLPKCETVGDIHAVEVMLRASERMAKRERPIGIEALIETAKGVANVEAIAGSSERLAAMVFGSGDYQLDLGSFGKSLSNERWQTALARIANACRAYGLAPIDGPFTAIADMAGTRADAQRAAAHGCEGKMAIHPSQIEVYNEVFSPPAEQVAWAREILAAMEAAAQEGRGAVRDKDGAMIDIVHIKIANKVLERADRIARRARG